MGLFDSIKNAASTPGVDPEQHAGLVQTITEMFNNHQGLTGLVNAAQSNGLGGIVQSWIGTGPNQQIAPDQVSSVVGQDRINEIAARAGIPPGIASAAVAHLLPMLVDRFTPHGEIPKAA